MFFIEHSQKYHLCGDLVKYFSQLINPISAIYLLGGFVQNPYHNLLFPICTVGGKSQLTLQGCFEDILNKETLPTQRLLTWCGL